MFGMITDAELQNALELLTHPNVQYKFSRSSGVRDLKVTFNDIQMAAATAFLLEPKSLPYVMALSANKLSSLVSSAQEYVATLRSDIGSIKRKIVPVQEATELVDAQTALQELASVADTVQDASTVPAYNRFKTATTEFLNKYRSNVVVDGALVPTPAQLRKEVPGRVQALKELHALIVEKATRIAAAEASYMRLNLPSAFTASMADQVRLILGRRSDRIQLMNAAEREEELRDTVIEVLAARGALRQIETKVQGLGIIQVSGYGYVHADAQYPIHQPYLVSKDGPFDVRTGSNTLQFIIDSEHYVTINLPASSDNDRLVLRGHAVSPYTMVANTLVLKSGSNTKSVLIPDGVYTASDIVSYLNSTANIGTIQLKAVERIEGSSHYVDIITTSSESLVTISAEDTGADQLGYAGVVSRSNYFMTARNLYLVLSSNEELNKYATVTTDDVAITVTTRCTGLEGKVVVDGSGKDVFSIRSATATTPWLRLEKTQTGIQPGDVIDTTAPVDSYQVISASSNILRVAPEMAYNRENFLFGVNAFVRSRVHTTAGELSDYLASWIAMVNLSQTYSDIDRMINNVLVDKNPTYSDINDLLGALLSISNGLNELQNMLRAHKVSAVEGIDAVLRTYQQKGCNRAIDLLLDCRFEEFFGLSLEEASYVGNMTKKLHDVAQNDLAIDANNRNGVEDRVLSSNESTDFDNDFSDSL